METGRESKEATPSVTDITFVTDVTLSKLSWYWFSWIKLHEKKSISFIFLNSILKIQSTEELSCKMGDDCLELKGVAYDKMGRVCA